MYMQIYSIVFKQFDDIDSLTSSHSNETHLIEKWK